MPRSPAPSSLAALVAILAACTAEPPPVAPVTVSSALAAVEPAPLPDVVEDLATLVPGNAGFVVELPAIDKLAELVPADQRAGIALVRPFLEGAAAERLGVESGALHDVADSFDRALAFGDAGSVVVVARFKEAKPVERLLAVLRPVAAASRPGVREVFESEAAPGRRAVFYPRPRLLVLGSSADAVAPIEKVGGGVVPSFAKDPRRLPEAANLRAFVDIAVMAAKDKELAKIFERGSQARIELGYDGKSTWSKAEISLIGAAIPRFSDVLEPKPSTLGARLPVEALGFVSTSLARRPNKKLRDVLVEATRGTGNDVAVRIVDDRLKQEIGLGLDDLDALVGDEMIAAIVAAPGEKVLADNKPNLEEMALFGAVATRDEARARKLLAAIGKVVGVKNASKDYKVQVSPTSIKFTPLKPADPPARIELKKGAIVGGIGAARWLDRATKAFDTGERALGGSAYYKASAAVAKPESLLLWFDLAATSKALGRPAQLDRAASLRAFFEPSPRGIELAMEGENGAEVFLGGAGAAAAIYGVRRYLANAKTAEARNTIGAIARSAVSSYERETASAATLSGPVVHALCKSAKPVPAKVPSGDKYAPAKGDYDTGDDLRGWRCLRFEMTSPQHYQYEYRQGGPYKGPARGGPDPGPKGFEVSAEGDLNGDGKTSLFTRTGTIDPKTQTIVLSKEIFVADEFE